MSLFEKVIESTSSGKLIKYQNLLTDSSQILSLLNRKNDNFEAFSNLGVSSSEMEFRVKEDKVLMERLALMPEVERREMGCHGQEIIARYTPNTWAENFLELMDRLTAMKKRK